jgi:hypothetical protein
MPARLYVSEIGRAHIAGVWRDRNDIDHARVYTLEKPAAAAEQADHGP